MTSRVITKRHDSLAETRIACLECDKFIDDFMGVGSIESRRSRSAARSHVLATGHEVRVETSRHSVSRLVRLEPTDD